MDNSNNIVFDNNTGFNAFNDAVFKTYRLLRTQCSINEDDQPEFWKKFTYLILNEWNNILLKLESGQATINDDDIIQREETFNLNVE
jgi:hypothetical protein